jgi:hypothetical protein
MTQEPTYRIAKAFDEAWRKPSPDELICLIHPNTVLYQPHLPPIHGRENAYREFELFLNWMPLFHGEVKHFVGRDQIVYIDWIMHFTIGRCHVPIRAIDKITLVDDLIHERAVYFNTLPLIKVIARTPSIWLQYWKYRTAKRVNSRSIITG